MAGNGAFNDDESQSSLRSMIKKYNKKAMLKD
jgi:hypothetical protein